jgi:DNA-binding transcriptional ArsR family regulator
MDGCENMQFKQCAVIKFLRAEKIPPINIRHHMQAVYGDKYVDVRRDTGYGRLSKKKWGKQV